MHKKGNEKNDARISGTEAPYPVAVDVPPPGRSSPSPYRPRHTPLWNNLLTVTGIFLAITGVLGLLTFGLFTLVTPVTNPYVDIVGYLVVPGILVVGLVLMPLGILFKSWRLHRRDPRERLTFLFPHIDLADPSQRKAAKLVVGGTFLLLPVVGVSSYHGYHYTDSAGFCAESCHAVMEPQATAYEHSAHARVRCAECHIGTGASWFVKSKLSGTRQVIATWRNTYPRPIPPAITELRPARETCEQCHWPKKFFGAQLAERVRFATDEKNTRREINMLLKTGGGDEATGRAEGIHMHMALSGRIEYIATDEKLQDIPWVRMIERDGTELIYRSDGKPSSDPRPAGQVRNLDCMDCHNRPAHKFLSPSEAVDLFLEVGQIDTTLPFIKREAVAALARPYRDVKNAETQMGAALSDFYGEHYPEIWKTRRASINLAIDKVREIYRRNFFPTMKVDWQTYPDNIGHKTSPGCFRCHEGRHVNQRGELISHACDICHTFLNPVAEEGKAEYIQRGEFIHSLKLDGPHATVRCDRCHTGGAAPEPTCAGCHATIAAFRGGTLADFAAFKIPAEPMADSV
ncbi:MAG: NapC/NirT family cytochrome c, partial [Planctomycetota bacterium]